MKRMSTRKQTEEALRESERFLRGALCPQTTCPLKWTMESGQPATDQQAHIFDRFCQIDGSVKREYGGGWDWHWSRRSSRPMMARWQWTAKRVKAVHSP